MDADYAKTYAAMDDGELVALAAESDELVEEARKALWSELQRRGLEKEAADAYSKRPPHIPPLLKSTDNLVTIMVLTGLAKAHLAKTKLESEGIQCLLADEHMVRMNWFYTFLLGRIKLQVNERDADRASEVLQECWDDLISFPGSETPTGARRFKWLTLKNMAWFFLILWALQILVVFFLYVMQGLL